MVPLHIQAQMSAGHIPTVDGTLHLDGILAAAVMGSRLVGATVAYKDRVTVPLPLRCVWVSPDGWPLWAATDLRAKAAATSEIYIHKRHPNDRAPLAAQTTVNTSAGRYKDVRMPLRVDLAPILTAWCLGDQAAIADLLSGVEHIGRKGSVGQGRVLGWRVEPADVDEEWILDRRPVPIDYLAAASSAVPAARIVPRASWTPPYWDAPRHLACRRSAWTP